MKTIVVKEWIHLQF